MRKEKILFGSNGEPLFENSYERIILNDEEKAEVSAAIKTLKQYKLEYSSPSDNSIITRLNSQADTLDEIEHYGGFASVIGIVWSGAALYSLLWEQNASTASLFMALCFIGFCCIAYIIFKNRTK